MCSHAQPEDLLLDGFIEIGGKIGGASLWVKHCKVGFKKKYAQAQMRPNGQTMKGIRYQDMGWIGSTIVEFGKPVVIGEFLNGSAKATLEIEEISSSPAP